MSWFFRKQNVKPDYTALQLQTAVSTLPVPIVWGQTKLAPNVIFYSNFQTHGGNVGKGGFFGSGGSAASYSADIIMALCEGPIGGIGYIWRDQSTFTLAQLSLTLFNGTTPQSNWNYLSNTYPSQALAYQGTAYVCAANYQLGSAADVGNHNFEVIGAFAGTGANGIDADPAKVIYDFLTNGQYGAGFDPASIDLTTLYGTGGDASLQTYCNAVGVALSPALISAEQASSILSRWLTLTNCAAVWSGGMLKFIPYGDLTIASGPTVQVVSSPIPIPGQKSDGSYPPPAITVASPANYVSDGGVIHAFTGSALAFSGASAPTAPGQYGISPSGTYLFHAADEGTPVEIKFTVNIPVSYVPNLMPIYDLTDVDFIYERGNKDPVQVNRVDPFSLPTVQRIECLSRSNQYGSSPVEARDQSQIELLGLRIGPSLQAHEVTDPVVVGSIIAQTSLQRALYVRTKFSFTLSWEYCLLDPMDIVTITDANIGLAKYPVRIVSIEEDDKGLLTVTAEEFVAGVSTPANNPTSSIVAWQPNQAAAAPSINAPLIYEPPALLTNNVAQVWVGASGAGGNIGWGGANVWASVDGATYSQLGTISSPLRQGLTTAPLSAAVNWDTTNALSVDLSQSGGTITGTSAESAQSGSTLALIGSELLAYESATLTASEQYNLSGLARGLYATVGAAHAAGAEFYRLDTAVAKYDLPSTWIGVHLYFKFQSFNAFGAGIQDLSECFVYVYTPNGDGAIGPVTQALLIGTNLDFGYVSQSTNEFDNWGAVSSATTTNVDLGKISI